MLILLDLCQPMYKVSSGWPWIYMLQMQHCYVQSHFAVRAHKLLSKSLRSACISSDQSQMARLILLYRAPQHREGNLLLDREEPSMG